MNASTCQIQLITGPARSGKSEWAETLAQQSGKQVIYVATALTPAGDQDWLARIEKHQQRRPQDWKTVLVPLELGVTLQAYAQSRYCVLVDSLGTWVANGLAEKDTRWQKRTQALMQSLTETAASVILVAEETGWGVVPAYPMGRAFRDRLGELIRELAIVAEPVYLVVGGHCLNLSILGVPLPPLKSLP